MSRAYNVFVEVKKEFITNEQLTEVMVSELGWEEIDSYSDKELNTFTGDGCLCGGQSEQEAHDQVLKELQKINPKTKVRTTWTYLENLPCESYGDI